MFLCDKGMAIPQIKFGFFLTFKQSVWPFSGLLLALFGFLLNFSSGIPDEDMPELSFITPHRANKTTVLITNVYAHGSSEVHLYIKIMSSNEPTVDSVRV